MKPMKSTKKQTKSEGRIQRVDRWLTKQIARFCPFLSEQHQRWLKFGIWAVIVNYAVSTLSSLGSDPISAIVLPLLGLAVWQLYTMLTTSSPKSRVKRGASLVSSEELQEMLNPEDEDEDDSTNSVTALPQIEIAGVQIPSELENLGFFFVGSPGSGKTQAIKRVLADLRQRPDFRVICLDRNGELLEAFYDEGRDLLFNPKDARSLLWNHLSEGLEPETIAGGLVPDDPKDRFFSEAAKSLLSDLFERCQSNGEIWEVISRFSLKELQDFLTGGVSARYFGAENTGASVLSTLVNEMRFYRRLADGEGFSFSQWGRQDDPRWLFLPVFEDDSEQFKPLYTMAFELMLRGLLGHPDPESRTMKTAIVIDELGALNQLRSLVRILAEGRKFGATALLGTQTEAQIDRNYGEYERRVILQGTATKLILNCRDGQTASMMADLIGKQERVDIQRGIKDGIIPEYHGGSEVIREVHLVMPAELQGLPNLKGYLVIANGTPPARVRVEPKRYPKGAERFVPAELGVVPFQGSGLVRGESEGSGGNGKIQDLRRFQQKGR